MSEEKTFTFAGVSDLKGEYKIRFCNAIERVKVLDKGGHKDIRIVELPEAMNKLAGAKYLLGLSDFSDECAQYAISDCITAEEAKLAKPVKQPKKSKVVEQEVVMQEVEIESNETTVSIPVQVKALSAAMDLVESELDDMPY